MQVTLDPAAILIGVFMLLLGVVQLFGMSWIRSVQEKLKANEARDSEFQKAIAAVREMMARDYVPRSENQAMRDEFRDGLRSIDQKLTDITNKLDRKQDKP
ncbi:MULTISPECIES: hypothetical protein [Burkholderia]|uniref:hypothetical protein n=1 Tax=Burkholderia TaxID=32008 RepID=UPI000531F0B6|nr:MULTISPECIES: hypothetical protein [Burkholderia]AOJ69239.1 hypothetical protein WS78_11070 [Burkholderia savannae]KGS01577.1 hypothetical protein X946_1023 [Burkholderia sp. ABCPW 111]KVG48986.1 hypothetical protein WS77_26570 [Burkholderia sp. MSMB0265]KVG78738.1 hypothetical protein WS81_15300 [Burkholderia sp. MSMB2040]KVG92078.1 hypothetical protein WS83_12250 [Burkholderia sp. MSMB2042]